MPPTPPPMPKTSSISGSKREKNSHDNQGEFMFRSQYKSLLLWWIQTLVPQSNFSLSSLLLFLCSLSGRRLSLVLYFPHWQWRVSIWTLGRQHYLGWSGDGWNAHATCSYTGSQWWEYHSRYIQKLCLVRIHVPFCSVFPKIGILPAACFRLIQNCSLL